MLPFIIFEVIFFIIVNFVFIVLSFIKSLNKIRFKQKRYKKINHKGDLMRLNLKQVKISKKTLTLPFREIFNKITNECASNLAKIPIAL